MTREQRHYCMSRIRSKDTSPELVVRRELWRLGYRYRLNVRRLPGTPDIVLGKYRTVIFVNGCFWHGHQGCPKFIIPKSNADFWKSKIARNRERDLLNAQRLETLAWNVVTVWECGLSGTGLAETMTRIDAQIKAGKVSWDEYRERRRRDRAFASEEARRQREVRDELEAEVDSQFHIPQNIRRMSRTENDV